MDHSHWWVGRLAFSLGVTALLAFAGGPLLAHFGVASPMAGFALFALGGVLGVVCLVAGIATALYGDGYGFGLIAGAVITVVFVTLAAFARRYPPINDITTDILSLPQFVSAASPSGGDGRDMGYQQASFAPQQQASYPDIKPLPVNLTPDEAFRRVEAAARQMPDWTITHDDPAARVIEGVATTRLFRFKDDFVIEVRPDGNASIVHMRSRSRDGKGDVGANAARIRAFFARLG